MYEMLCAYAKKFGKDFPISAVMGNSNENGVIQLVQKCINEGKPFKKPAEEKTKPDADAEK
ncbi:hypothetical protein [Selenomonas ruminantium]|uniref:hypothetical protein n=1 Tax=Selenomonas ruminantium TaxID=971 RepID=UPI0026EB7E8E|nr:hypothetical protein [Selenomonas ruminantium]